MGLEDDSLGRGEGEGGEGVAAVSRQVTGREIGLASKQLSLIGLSCTKIKVHKSVREGGASECQVLLCPWAD